MILDLTSYYVSVLLAGRVCFTLEIVFSWWTKPAASADPLMVGTFRGMKYMKRSEFRILISLACATDRLVRQCSSNT